MERAQGLLRHTELSCFTSGPPLIPLERCDPADPWRYRPAKAGLFSPIVVPGSPALIAFNPVQRGD